METFKVSQQGPDKTDQRITDE